MKTTVWAMALCLVTGLSASAQEPGNHFRKGHHHHRMDLANKLHFNDQQKQQWNGIKKDYAARYMDLNKQENITVKEMRDRKETLRKDEKKAFQNLLTSDQKQQLADMKKQMAAKRQEMAAKRLDEMKTRLGLSDDQTAKIKDLNNSFYSQLKQYRENESLARPDKRDQIIALVKQHRENLRAVLTPEQQDKMKQMREERKDRRENL
jgi:hypothetical protein